MEDTEERVEADDLEDAEPEPQELEDDDGDGDGAPSRNGDGADVESIEEILVKKDEAENAEEDSEDESMLTLPRDDKVESVAVKVVPPQATEFVCARCRLVKHRSQLADKSKMLCRDCA